MSWRQSHGRHTCNRCRMVIPSKADVYIGETTRQAWCGGCAGAIGQVRPVGVLPATVPVGDWDGFNPQLMGATLRAKIRERRRGEGA